MKENSKELLSSLIDNEWDERVSLSDSLSDVATDNELRDKFARYHLIRDVMHKEHNATLDTNFSARVSAAIAQESLLDVGPPATESNVSDLAARRDAIGREKQAVSEPVTSEPAKGRTSEHGFNWKVGAGGLAIAASVALVSLVGLNTLQQQNGSQPASQIAENNNKILQGVELQQVAAQSNAVVPVSNQTVNDQQPVIRVQGGAAYGSPIEYVSNTSTYWVTPNQQRNSITEKRLNMFLSQHIEQSPTADLGGMLPYSRLAGYDTAPAAEQQ